MVSLWLVCFAGSSGAKSPWLFIHGKPSCTPRLLAVALAGDDRRVDSPQFPVGRTLALQGAIMRTRITLAPARTR
jgi:hypothetical protein